jgi:N-acetylmuramoyl-L-alanine amidase
MIKAFIDAGHGGPDPGAAGYGLIEKHLNLTVALELRRILLASHKFEVLMSRVTDSANPSISTRANMANEWGADIVIAVHHNAGMGTGFDIIHTVFTDSSIGDELAIIVASKFEELGQTKHGVYSRWNSSMTADYYGMIRLTNAPSIITEFAFIDSEDYRDVDTQSELEAEAKATADALFEFYGVDSNVSDWAKEAQAWVIEQGISGGNDPKGVATRKQIWTMLHRMKT